MTTSASTEIPAPSATESPRGAPLWRRFGALFYDFLILAAISMLYGALAVVLYVAFTGDTGEAYTPMFDGIGFQLGWIVIIVAFYCFFWRKGGQTLGMRAWRLQLQGSQGGTVSWKQALTRCILGPFALGVAAVGYWWAWFDPKRDCLHDRLSGTRVVVLQKSAGEGF